MLASAALLFIAAGLSVTPDSVPAHGQQESIVTLEKPAMVHLQTAGAVAPRCEIVDHLRGPFDTSGVAGKTHCSFDLLLDSGTYKVRMQAPAKGKGSIALKATPFTEVNTSTPKLELGRTVEQVLHPQQQASFWIRVEQRSFVSLRVAGRTAGGVEVWRDGQWRTDMGAHAGEISPTAGQPVYEWWLQSMLEPGDYLVTAYGASPKRWSKGTESDDLSVAYGFQRAPEERSASVTIPATGLVTLLLPKGSVAAVLSLPAAIETPTELSLAAMDASGSVSIPTHGGCRVEPHALLPDCTVSDFTNQQHVLALRGAPNTHATLQWIIRDESASSVDGMRFADTTATFHAPAWGEAVVGTYELMPDQDAAPLSCVLERSDNSNWTPVAYDSLKISPRQPFQRSFNFDQTQEIWFEVTEVGAYQIRSSGKVASSCELYRVEPGEPSGLRRLSEAVFDSKTCNLVKVLNPGQYQLHLFGNDRGIETIRIATKESPTGDTPNKASCLIEKASLDKWGEYRLRTNPRRDRTTRLLLLRPAPLTLSEALPLFVEPNRLVRLPVSQGSQVEVRGHGAFSCGFSHSGPQESKGGVCKPVSVSMADTLVISSKEPTSVAIVRPTPAPSLSPLASYSAKPIALPNLPLEQPQFFNFDREEMHSLLFDVKEAGLYRVETQGLLATRCEVRTAVVMKLAENSQGGRGRNCLVEQFLRPGRYLVSVQTVGASRGRGSVSLTRRAPREAPPVTADGEAFFAVAPGELIQEKLTVTNKKAVPYQVSTTARGDVAISCRFEDAQGWPLVRVPSPCSFSETLASGEYRWMQLPLTVESVRHTRIAKVRPPVVFSGNKVHAVPFNQWAEAKLRPSGKDEYFINLQAEMDLDIALTNRMQGRLYLINPDKSLKPVDVIPPMGVAETPASYTDVSSTGEEEGGETSPEEAPPPEEQPEAMPEEAPSEEAAPAEEMEAPTTAPTPPRRQRRPANVPALPTGHRVHLPAGPYKLITEHSQGDVGIRYRLFVGSETLAPGFSRELPVPGTVDLRMPQNGTLRLKTTGETDVRCRVFDQSGRLVTEVSHNGDDWNCALAEPLAAGDYKLVLEDEAQSGGSTTVSVQMPDVQDAGQLADGQKLKVESSVVTATLPLLTGDGVQEVDFTSPTAFSCALEDPSGAILERKLSVTRCGFLLRPAAGAYRARVWTLDQSTIVTASLATRPIQDRDDGRVKAGKVSRAHIQSPGTYATFDGALCLPEGTQGLFKQCGPESSFEAGAVLIGSLGGTASDSALKEVTVAVDSPQSESRMLDWQQGIQRQTSEERAIHLLQVTAPKGERSAPACALEGGLRALQATSCVAASRPGKSAIARWWAPTPTALESQITRAAAVLPTKSTPLSAGQRTLQWSGETARFSLPEQAYRADLTLATNAWAIRLESNGAVGDLCVAAKGFERCVMSGKGGELVLYSPDESRAEAKVVLLEMQPKPTVLSSLFEEVRVVPGTLRFDVTAAETPRALDVTGAVHCLTTLPDGTRLTGCSTLIPPKTTAQLAVEHDAGALRITLGAPEQPEATRFGGPLPSSAPSWIPWAQGVELSGVLVDRSFTIDQEAVVHVQAESGVCSLVSGSTFLATEGFGSACEINRLLKPGTYRVLVRPFAQMPLSGTLAWTTESITKLDEGIGPETWIAPSETKLFTFSTKSPGKVGFGVRVPAETLDCAVLDASQRLIGTGCQQFLQLDTGSYVLSIHAPASSPATRFKPVLAGLAGATREVPEEYLRDFFQRIGEEQ